jgi:hypothetical protein
MELNLAFSYWYIQNISNDFHGVWGYMYVTHHEFFRISFWIVPESCSGLTPCSSAATIKKPYGSTAPWSLKLTFLTRESDQTILSYPPQCQWQLLLFYITHYAFVIWIIPTCVSATERSIVLLSCSKITSIKHYFFGCWKSSILANGPGRRTYIVV